MGALRRKHSTTLCYVHGTFLDSVVKLLGNHRVSESKSSLRLRSNPRIDLGPSNRSPRRRQVQDSLAGITANLPRFLNWGDGGPFV